MPGPQVRPACSAANPHSRTVVEMDPVTAGLAFRDIANMADSSQRFPKSDKVQLSKLSKQLHTQLYEFERLEMKDWGGEVSCWQDKGLMSKSSMPITMILSIPKNCGDNKAARSQLFTYSGLLLQTLQLVSNQKASRQWSSEVQQRLCQVGSGFKELPQEVKEDLMLDLVALSGALRESLEESPARAMEVYRWTVLNDLYRTVLDRRCVFRSILQESKDFNLKGVFNHTKKQCLLPDITGADCSKLSLLLGPQVQCLVNALEKVPAQSLPSRESVDQVIASVRGNLQQLEQDSKDGCEFTLSVGGDDIRQFFGANDPYWTREQFKVRRKRSAGTRVAECPSNPGALCGAAEFAQDLVLSDLSSQHGVAGVQDLSFAASRRPDLQFEATCGCGCASKRPALGHIQNPATQESCSLVAKTACSDLVPKDLGCDCGCPPSCVCKGGLGVCGSMDLLEGFETLVIRLETCGMACCKKPPQLLPGESQKYPTQVLREPLLINEAIEELASEEPPDIDQILPDLNSAELRD